MEGMAQAAEEADEHVGEDADDGVNGACPPPPPRAPGARARLLSCCRALAARAAARALHCPASPSRARCAVRRRAVRRCAVRVWLLARAASAACLLPALRAAACAGVASAA